MATPFLERAEIAVDEETNSRLERSAGFLKTRCSTLADAPDAGAFLFLSRPLEITGKAAKPLKKETAPEMLSAVHAALQDESLWKTADALDARLQALADAKNVGFGQIGQPVRAALTAGRPSPSLGEVLYGLGQAESLGRLSDQIAVRGLESGA